MADWHSPAGHSQDTGAREKSDTNQSDSGHGARRAALALVTDSGRRDAVNAVDTVNTPES